MNILKTFFAMNLKSKIILSVQIIYVIDLL